MSSFLTASQHLKQDADKGDQKAGNIPTHSVTNEVIAEQKTIEAVVTVDPIQNPALLLTTLHRLIYPDTEIENLLQVWACPPRRRDGKKWFADEIKTLKSVLSAIGILDEEQASGKKDPHLEMLYKDYVKILFSYQGNPYKVDHLRMILLASHKIELDDKLDFNSLIRTRILNEEQLKEFLKQPSFPVDKQRKAEKLLAAIHTRHQALQKIYQPLIVNGIVKPNHSCLIETLYDGILATGLEEKEKLDKIVHPIFEAMDQQHKIFQSVYLPLAEAKIIDAKALQQEHSKEVADVNMFVSAKKEPPLVAAARTGDLEILLENGAKPYLLDYDIWQEINALQGRETSFEPRCVLM